jgi:DNA-binding FadR family transcriptional regulator
MGSRKAAERLNEMGFRFSEATVSRLLRRLDQRTWTSPVGTKGRVLTVSGRSRVAEVESQLRRDKAFIGAIDIRSVQQVLDLLVARKTVERETARGAATNATDEELRQLVELVEKHRAALARGEVAREAALNFHRLIGKACRNRLLMALSQVVFDPNLDSTEDVLDLITQAHGHGHQSFPEHERVLAAILARDAAAAEREMVDHFDRAIDDVIAFLSSGRVEAVDRLLARASM